MTGVALMLFVCVGGCDPVSTPTTDEPTIELADTSVKPPADGSIEQPSEQSVEGPVAGEPAEPPREKEKRPRLKVGDAPPAFQSREWLGAETVPTWEGLKGKVVLLDFWATWCGPCVEGIPEMNELQERYRDEGLVVLGITWEQAETVREFQEKVEMKYPVGCGGLLAKAVRTRGLPHLFLFGRDGKLFWEGNPAYGEQRAKVVAALAAKAADE